MSKQPNVTKIVWRFYFAGPAWSDAKFEWHYVPAILGGILYMGFTVFGRSILYSSDW